MNKTIKKVRQWGAEKGIFEKSSAYYQFEKMLEEVYELHLELLKHNPSKESIKNEIGDIVVTLIMQCEFHGLSLQECLEAAYNKISKRTGKMKDGKFVKDGK